MEPGHEDRENLVVFLDYVLATQPQWSPVTRTGKTSSATIAAACSSLPQWSPVTRTGKTGRHPDQRPAGLDAAMEPGHEDRENPSTM